MSKEEEEEKFNLFIKNLPDPGDNFQNFCEGIRDFYDPKGRSKIIPYSSRGKGVDLQKYKLRIISVQSTPKIKKIITEAKKDGIKNIVIYIENSKTFEIYDLRVTGDLNQKRCESFLLGDLSNYYYALRRLFSLSFGDEFNFYNNGKGYPGIDGFRFIVLASSKLVIHNKKKKIYPDPYNIYKGPMIGHEEYDLTENKKLIDYLTTAKPGRHPELISDHIISQAYAYKHGGDCWSISKMIEFEYSLDNQVITKYETNLNKSDRGPSEWLPILEENAGHVSSLKDYEKRILGYPKSQQNLIREIIEDYCFTWDEVSKRFGIQLEKADANILNFVSSSATTRRRKPQPINPHYYRGGRRLVWPY